MCLSKAFRRPSKAWGGLRTKGVPKCNTWETNLVFQVGVVAAIPPTSDPSVPPAEEKQRAKRGAPNPTHKMLLALINLQFLQQYN